MERFKAYRLTQTADKTIRAEFVDCTLEDLDPGDVLVRVAYSDVNYKDALAATGKGKILRRASCIGGIDFSGTVVASSDAFFAEGDAVLGVGYDLGVSHHGGYAQYARVPLAFHLLALLARWPWVVARMRRRTERDPERAARRSIADPVLRARTLQDPHAGPLFTALLLSPFDRMALRLPGTANDIAVTRATTYPLEQIAVPVLIVHGTGDRLVPFAPHATSLAARVPGAELLAIEGGEHVAIFTHRTEVRARVTRFLREHAPPAAAR